MGKDKGIYCKTSDEKVTIKVHQSDKKRKKKKKHTKIVHNSSEVHRKRDQGMTKYGTPPEEVHPEAQR